MINYRKTKSIKYKHRNINNKWKNMFCVCVNVKYSTLLLIYIIKDFCMKFFGSIQFDFRVIFPTFVPFFIVYWLSLKTLTTDLNANHSGMSSPPLSICRNLVPDNFFSSRSFSLASSAVTYPSASV